MTGSLLELTDVRKNYQGLRPLRIDRLTIARGEHVAIVGLDLPMAEVLINLMTGAMVPEQGEVRVFGQPTSALSSGDEWLALVDRFGIVSERAALLEAFSVVQNLAMPFSLDIEPPSDELRQRATALAKDVGLPERVWDEAIGRLEPSLRVRARLARALALSPELVLFEHPSAAVTPGETAALGRDIQQILSRRPVASLTLTADATFANAVAGRRLIHDPVSGRLSEGGRFKWFGRGRGSQ